ncbi:MAG TPA: alpha/beta hydrolase [Acidimicrobiia bacterium]|jgi:acetyl esterase/lipase
MTTRWRALLTGGVVVATMALIGAGCDLLPSPNGPAPLRYRDAIFSSVSTTTNIQYGSAVNQSNQTQALLLDLYQPVGDTVTSRPAIVWVHGGSFTSGDKSEVDLVDEANVFSKEGYVNVSINYRLGPGCSFANPTASCIQSIFDAQHDAQAAVRWLRANASTYHVDPNRIAIGGSSAGAITALQVAYNPTDVGTSGNPGFSSAVEAAQSISGTALPPNLPKPGAPPTVDFHGTADPLVPYSLGQQTVNNAVAVGDFSVLETFPGAGHVPYAQFRSQILQQTSNLFYFAMDLSHAAQ